MPYAFKHGDRPLDDYSIQRAVGSGGFGEVYYALSDGGREVALKYLKENPQVELRGVSHCINLKSPHLIAIFDVKKSAQNEYFLVMEYCSGPSLRDLLIAEPNGFGPQKAAFFVREIAKGLAYLHDRGIVHRDLKPGNIFFDDGYVKIGDYGLSKFISISRHSAQTASVGTVHYMAPEIGSGNYSRGVDIYALGVILYEMLLGRVPFEGSSMGEVLMKHLTAQPAVDELPQPFAHVIRKALQKDPRDRYQNVNEMVDELLAVEDVQQSLAGFSVKSLEGAVRRGQSDAAVSPIPSPNPPPRYGPVMDIPVRPAQGMGYRFPLPDRLTKRMDRVSRKVERKIAKLGGHPSPQGEVFGPFGAPVRIRGINVPGRKGGPAVPLPWETGHPAKRLLLSITMVIGSSIGLGMLCGSLANSDEIGATAGMLVPAMWGGILLSRKAMQWFGVVYGPKWSQRIVGLLCCAPLIAIASAPALDSKGEDALGLFLGLVVVAVFTNWAREFAEGAQGELKAGTAVRAAFFALIVSGIGTAMADGEPEFMMIAASVAGLVSICLQPAAWWLSSLRSSPAAAEFAERGDVAPNAPPESAATPGASPIGGQSPPPVPPVYQGAGLAGNVHPYQSAPSATVKQPSMAGPEPQRRWGVARAFWGLLAFVFTGGAIVTFLIPLTLNDMARVDVVQCVTTCIALTAATLFALGKTTPHRRDGFWRETLRPFLIAFSFFGIGAMITGLAGAADQEGATDGPAVSLYEDGYGSAVEMLDAEGRRLNLAWPKTPKMPEAPMSPDVEDCPETKTETHLDRKAKRREAARERWERAITKMEVMQTRMGHLGRNAFRIHWGPQHTAICITGLVLSSLAFLGLLLFSGRRRPQPSFVQSQEPRTSAESGIQGFVQTSPESTAGR